MAADGQIVFEITADGKKAIADIKDVTRAIQQETKKWDDSVDSSANNMSGAMAHALDINRLKDWGIQAAKALVNFGKEAISAASDLQEVQNVVDVTFGASASAIDSWAKKAGTQFGLTETQAKKFTSTIGAMAKSSGIGSGEIVEMSTSLSGLAADMASFYNLDFDTAFEKIRSGISGETEPLKQLGINMSVANLEAYALSQGITKAFKDMDQGEQTMLRYQYLMQATADAQGDFARTSDGYANSVRTLTTNLESLKTKIGEVILPFVSSVVEEINKLFEDRSGDHTVLDDFADIDKNTAEQIEKIKTTADDARELVSELEKLGGTSVGEAGGKVQELVSKLAEVELSDDKATAVKEYIAYLRENIDEISKTTGADAQGVKDWIAGIEEAAEKISPDDTEGWTQLVATIKEGLPGFDKAGSQVQKLATDLEKVKFDQSKAGVVSDFLGVLSANVDALAAIQGTEAEGAKKWLESISASASTLEEGDVEGWTSLINMIKEGLPGIEETDFGAKFFEALGAGFDNLSSKSSVLEWVIDTLGNKTNRTEQEQALWLATCKKLVQTIPGLSSIINTQTGEIEGGTQAVKDYIQAWEDGQTKLALLGALEQKESAYSERFANIPELELDLALARRRVKKAKEELKKLFDDNGVEYNPNNLLEYAYPEDLVDPREIDAAVGNYADLVAKEEEASNAYQTQKDALDEAKVAIEEYRATVEELPGTIEEATEATEEWSQEQINAGKAAVTAAEEAIKALADYTQEVHDATQQAVDGVISGFGRVIRDPKEINELIAKRDELIKKQAGLNQESEEYKKLQKEIIALNDQISPHTADKMKTGLEDQKSFMEQYLANLEQAKKMGLSDELLASLSDGSLESAEYLASLVDPVNAALAGEVDKLYQEVQEQKAGFVDALTQQKLAADETYDALVAKAKESVAAMNLSGEAETAMGDTIEGLAKGISSHVPEVTSAVDSIIAELARLSGYGITLDLGASGNIPIVKPSSGSFVPMHSQAKGLDYVPFSGYLAQLHEGEAILTAEENRIWQNFRNGGASMRNVDYDALGGVMRDNVKAGGDVYLDGRTVGHVISAQQATSYRNLQRSGWQA